MEQGLIVSLQFTAFSIEAARDCRYDGLTITDGDGTILMEKSCGSELPADILSRSNIVDLYFNTDGSVTMSGWSVSWSAVTPGEPGLCGGTAENTSCLENSCDEHWKQLSTGCYR